MKAKGWLMSSLGLNVILAAVLLSRNQPASPRGQTANSRKDVKPGKVVSVSQTHILVGTNVVFPVLDWRSVEAPDYRQYIANLRAIGCPGETIKDIVIADVMKLYASRADNLRREKRAFRYWETDEKRLIPEKQQEGFRQSLLNLHQEPEAILHELLGINLQVELRRYLATSLLEEDEELSFLDEDKRSRLFGLRAEFEWRRAQAEERSKTDASGEAAHDERQKIDAEERAALAQLLTPAEMQEYEQATSNLGTHLRARLVGFNPTPEEFQKVYHLYKETGLRSVWLGSANSPAKEEEKADLGFGEAEQLREQWPQLTITKALGLEAEQE